MKSMFFMFLRTCVHYKCKSLSEVFGFLKEANIVELCTAENVTNYFLKSAIRAHHIVVSQLRHVQRTKSSSTTSELVTVHAAPLLSLTLDVEWMMLLWRAVAAYTYQNQGNTCTPKADCECHHRGGVSPPGPVVIDGHHW